ncbi:exo-alpha-sialidase [Planctomycetales bacterium ZRK34]|nr:exo-alpha-sialidase [Planctomycetales bacterium ZRK34]
MRIICCVLALAAVMSCPPPAAGEANQGVAVSRSFDIPLIDLSQETDRHVIVAAGTESVYQGHPTTVLLPDGKTMFAVWTHGHGGPCGPMKKSTDGGKTWSDPLPTPDSWTRVRNCPTIYRLVDPEGKARLFVFAIKDDGLVSSYSEDDGTTWTPMRPIDGLNMTRIVMPWCTIVPIDGGRKLLASTNARRPGDPDRYSNILIQSISTDGGLTWGPARVIGDLPGFKLCEPCIVRSPDGKQLLCLIRENVRQVNARFIVSDDEGRTWSEPKFLQGALTGDRHQARYAPDGRLVVVFRDMAAGSPTRGHFVGWVGTYDDIIHQRQGQYRLKLLHNYAATDCGYPGLELLPDGTFVATTYIKYWPDQRKHSVISTRFKLDELDQRVK